MQPGDLRQVRAPTSWGHLLVIFFPESFLTPRMGLQQLWWQWLWQIWIQVSSSVLSKYFERTRWRPSQLLIHSSLIGYIYAQWCIWVYAVGPLKRRATGMSEWLFSDWIRRCWSRCSFSEFELQTLNGKTFIAHFDVPILVFIISFTWQQCLV